MELEFGVETFGDVLRTTDEPRETYAQALRHVVEQGVLADAVNIDFFGIGEHHRWEYAASAPEIPATAIAARTRHIHVGTAVTVLSSDDPIRVFQRFASLDGISEGRAEVILGRGSFTESFPLFGYDLRDYEKLFEEKLEIFALARKQRPFSWSGSTRDPLQDQQVFPLVEDGLLTTWVGVGGSPESVVRAARHGFRLMLALIGGSPSRFRPYVNLFHQASDKFGQARQPVGMHSIGHIADTDEQAREAFWPALREMAERIGKLRGFPPMTRADYERYIGPSGAMAVGSPETVAQKIARNVRLLGIDRFDLKYGNGGIPHADLMHAIELYGSKVIPRVRELLAAEPSTDERAHQGL
ncbi:Atu2307/SP_0267 family LLM class monooxygenase [Micromonospora sp. CA-240977]|uniref:Atu2307/SP_0267 family LLM class monooxygenase n=1 Tax=Micromonospora sp. CA-240977 TaxID=3239957 RepID=UPI003D9213A9